MNRITVNALVDLGCLVTLIPTLITGLVLYVYLPSGSGKGGTSWMGITRHDWVLYHDIAGFAFAALIILHLILHWMYFWNIRNCLTPGSKKADAGET
ncbi:DUF4405 domain-containing protein [Methanoregula sp.]|jgi:hypothetical protein|uniref:DUF4405 domain-containing protein n=1 Tax=Methanoregula sp. TaxID=2052170 RepID=UPI003565E835